MIDSGAKSEKQLFKFKQFEVEQQGCAMKVGTDGILLGAWADTKAVTNVLDIGTGTGLIALMLAQRTAATIHAVEIEEVAFMRATGNFLNSSWKSRIKAYHESIQDFGRSTDQQFDLIVSNPPFFSGGVLSFNENKNLVRHTIKLPNGDLLSTARNLLTKNGKFCVILPVLEGLRFKEMAQRYGLYCTKLTEVIPKPDKPANRLLMQFEKSDVDNISEDQLVLRQADQAYSIAFKTMTKDFYLNF